MGLETASLGGHLDLTLGPHWPTGFPGYTPDSPETMKELVHGQVFVQSGQTYTGTLPLPVAAPSGNETGNPNVMATPKLAAVLIARANSTNDTTSVVTFDPSTVQVITSRANNNTISWTAPDDGVYVLVAAYGRGTGQIQNIYDGMLHGTYHFTILSEHWLIPNQGNADAPKVTYPFPAYIVDHFSKGGVEAGVKYWDEHVLTTDLYACLARYAFRDTSASSFHSQSKCFQMVENS